MRTIIKVHPLKNLVSNGSKEIDKGFGKKIGNVQGKARKLRYRIAEEFMREHGIPYLLTGHQLDDSLENYLLKQLKGQSGKATRSIFHPVVLRGTQTVPSVHEQSTQFWQIKPLLHYTKQEVSNYAQTHQLEFMNDSSNHEINYERNFIRNITFPQWDQKFPSWKKNIVRHHHYQSVQHDLLLQCLETQMVKPVYPFLILSKEFFNLPVDNRTWILHYYFNDFYPGNRFSHGEITELNKKIAKGQKGVELGIYQQRTVYYSHHLIGPILSQKELEGFPHLHINQKDIKTYFENSHDVKILRELSEEPDQKVKKKVIRKLSNNTIPSMARKSGWIVETAPDHRYFISHLIKLEPAFKQFSLKTRLKLTI